MFSEFFWLSREMLEDNRIWEEEDIRCTLKPTAVPRVIGSRTEAAGFANTAAGSVRDGIKVVIAGILVGNISELLYEILTKLMSLAFLQCRF